ncbi:hypothetical protein [Streptomyces sp. NPDC004065]|uniref:hypothetical protein n=1 Tax=Streptomyces sp. NPDC004065 TaxID=3364689 RepID=UPI00384B103C
MRRVCGVACLALGLTAVTGCTPPDLPLVAVRNGEDGQPVAELRPCGADETVSGMGLGSWPSAESDAPVGEAAPGPAGSAPPSPAARPGVDGSGGGRTAEEDPEEDSGWEAWDATVHGRVVFPVFSPPPAWRVQTFGRQRLLPGRTYSLSFRGSGGYRAHVHFTVGDLASLRPGQVWADDRAMSEGDFDALVDDKC